MTCYRGKANPDRHTQLRLFADSAGYCQRPECPNRLFVDTGTKNIHIAEIAHIIAVGRKGPRADTTVTQADKGAYDNLILLCANCHTTIDKAPKDYPDHTILAWKRMRVDRISSRIGAFECRDRVSTRTVIEPTLIENRAVFDQYGPHNDYRYDPESELAKVWKRKMRAIILPNNRKILAVLDANRRHLRPNEVATLEAFRQHIDDLEAKHIGEDSGDVASRFPSGMSDILTNA